MSTPHLAKLFLGQSLGILLTLERLPQIRYTLYLMFSVIPCVDIQKGNAVRLYEGDPSKETIYFDSPLKAAKHWQELGAQHLHVVDLDAATGAGNNKDSIQDIAQLDLSIELGGGIRDLQSARHWLSHVERIVLGTLAIKTPEVLDVLLQEYPAERIVVSIDAKNGLVATHGWDKLSEVKATDLAKRMQARGITQVIYTDITRDGTLKGVDPEPVKAMRQTFSHSLIAGGGVASNADLDLYESLGLEGAIVGRALYEGRIDYPRIARS